MPCVDNPPSYVLRSAVDGAKGLNDQVAASHTDDLKVFEDVFERRRWQGDTPHRFVGSSAVCEAFRVKAPFEVRCRSRDVQNCTCLLQRPELEQCAKESLITLPLTKC